MCRFGNRFDVRFSAEIISHPWADLKVNLFSRSNVDASRTVQSSVSKVYGISERRTNMLLLPNKNMTGAKGGCHLAHAQGSSEYSNESPIQCRPVHNIRQDPRDQNAA